MALPTTGNNGNQDPGTAQGEGDENRDGISEDSALSNPNITSPGSESTILPDDNLENVVSGTSDGDVDVSDGGSSSSSSNEDAETQSTIGSGKFSSVINSGGESSLVDAAGVSSSKTKHGMPPKSTASVMKLSERLTQASLSEGGVVFDESGLSSGSSMAGDLDRSSGDRSSGEGNYNTSTLRYFDMVLVHYGFDDKPKFVEAFTSKPGPGYTPSIRVSSNLKEKIDYLILDIVPFVGVPNSMDKERPRFGGNFLLDPKSPFSLNSVMKNELSFSSELLHDYISYTPKTNHVRINWSRMAEMGVTDFNLKLNFIDRSIEGGEISVETGVFQVSTVDNVTPEFQSFSVEVIKSGDEDTHKIVCSEPERYDNVPYMKVFNPEASTVGSFQRTAELTISRNLESRSKPNKKYFTRMDIDSKTEFLSPMIGVRDRSNIVSIKRPLASKETSLKLYTKSFYDGYVFDSDSSIFQDQFIERKLSHNLGSEKDGYTIFSINDNLGVLDNFVSVSSAASDVEFRREYISDELTNEAERKNIKSNYFIYINKDKAKASNKLNPIIQIEVSDKVKENITCSIGYKLQEDLSKTKDNFSIKLVAMTRIGDLDSPKTFAKELSIEWDSSDDFPYGKYTTYGSGSGSEKDGYQLRCLCIKDLYDILKSNIYGKISRSRPFGDKGSDTVGLFPTLGELYPELYPGGSRWASESIINVIKTKEYSGHYLLPLSRMWLGNKTGNNYESISERTLINISNFESTDPYRESPSSAEHIYCMGLEKTISLEKFTIMTPLARKVGAPGVRSKIKSYQSHLDSGDFEPISRGGAEDSRFYKWNTVRDSVDILREGHQFGTVTKGLSSIESSTMFGRKCQTKRYGAGTVRKTIGLASIGVPLYYYDDKNKVDGDSGWGEIPSYVISNMFVGSPSDPASMKKYINDWNFMNREIHFAYKSSSSFDSPGTGVGDLGLIYAGRTTNDNITSWKEELYPHGFDSGYGGKWNISYSTFNKHGNNVDGNYGKNNRQMLDPFLFGPKYQILFEGGDDVNGSTRRISYLDQFNTFSGNSDMEPDYNHIYNYIHEILQSRIRGGLAQSGSGTSVRSGSDDYKVSSNGMLNISGRGSIDYSVSFLRDQERNANKIYVISGEEEKSMELSAFNVVNEMRDRFGSALLFETSADFSLNDIFPIWESSFPEIQYKPGDSDVFIERIPDPYTGEVDPYSFVDHNYVSIKDPYVLNLFYSGKESLPDLTGSSEGVDISVIDGELIYRQSVLLEMGESTDVLYRKHSFNSSLFEFYINSDRYNAVHDLSNHINQKLLSKGIRFTNLLNYSRFYTPDKILETNGKASIIKMSQMDLNRHGLNIYGGSDGNVGLISGRYGALSSLSDSTISINVAFNQNNTLSSITPIIKDNLIGSSNNSLPVGLRRNRYRDDVQALLLSYIKNRDQQLSSVIANAKTKSDIKINVGKYGIESGDPGVHSPGGEYRSATSAETNSGLQVSLGGFVRDGNFITFNSPNSYFEPDYNVFFPLEFSVREAEVVILLVRVRRDDGSYYPDEGDEFSTYRASVSYSNGADTEQIFGIDQIQVPGADFIEYEEDALGDLETVPPAVLMIPIKSSVNNILIRSGVDGVEMNVKITNSPTSLDDFGFLAINRNNVIFNMQESKMSRSFGLVLDSLGAWDIIVSPEAFINRQANGIFNYLGLGYNRTIVDTDEEFIGGIGLSLPKEEDAFGQTLNDIFIDDSAIPTEVQDSVRLTPMLGYPKVFVLQIDPGVKEYLQGIWTQDPQSQEGCYLDIPLFFKGKSTGAEGTCSVRVFVNIECVTDYTLCDYFWNLSTPPSVTGIETLQNELMPNLTNYIDCTDESYKDVYGNVVSRHYVDCSISKVPMLDSGSAILLLKTSKNTMNISNYFKPSEEALNRISMQSGSVPPDAPWELSCTPLSSSEISIINKPVIYTDPGDLSTYDTDLSVIMSTIESSNQYMFINPQFAFPEQDIKGKCYSDEMIILGIGMSFMNWRVGQSPFITVRNILGVEISSPPNIITDFNISFCIKYLYNEDRKII